MAVASPLMETSINGAKGILVSIVGSPDMGLEEVEVACGLVESAAHPDANIIFGASFDESLDDEIVVTVIATGFDEKKAPYAVASDEPRNANLFTDARERAESQQPAAAPKPEEGEDPFDTIFKIFNNK